MRSLWKIKNFLSTSGRLSESLNIKSDFLIGKRSFILGDSSFLGKKIRVYNGRSFSQIEVLEKMDKFYLGSFSWSTLFGKKVQSKWLIKKNSKKKGKKKGK